MTVAFQSNNGNNSSGTSVAVLMPAGVVSGNLLFSEIFMAADKSASLAVSGGWTLLGIASRADYTYGIAYRVATGSGDQPTWSWTGSVGFAANTWRFTGQWAGGTPIGALSQAVGNSTTANTAAINAGGPGSYMLSFCTSFVASTTVPVPTGYTSISNFNTGPNPAGGERASQKTLTNLGDSSGSNSVTVPSGQWGTAIIEIRTQAPTETATVAQTLANISQSLTATEGEPSTIAQVFPILSQSLTAMEGEPSTIAQVFPILSQEIDVNVAALPTGNIAQTLPMLSQEIDVGALNGIIAQTFPLLEQSAAVIVEAPIVIDQILPGTIQEVIIAVETEILGIEQTLPMLLQEVDIAVGSAPRIVMTLTKIQQTFTAVEEVTTEIGMTLPMLEISRFDVYQTPPVIIAMEFPPLFSQEFDAVLSLDSEIGMIFLPLYNTPDEARIDMVLGGTGVGGPPGSWSRSWWYPT